MSHDTIVIIGAGNMGGSVIGGLINNQFPAQQIYACDPDPEKLAFLKNNFGIHTTVHPEEALAYASIVIFAIKPQLFAEIALALAPVIIKIRPLVISVAAGIRIASIQQWLGEKVAIVRCMPNTPALVGCGATALFANAQVTAEQKKSAEAILHAIGIFVWLTTEAQMDAVTALSGSGPAYFFLVMEAMEAAGIALGLPTEICRLLTLQTALGAARMAMESDVSPAELRQRVTSPGGTTEKALSVLEKHFIRDSFKEALEAAKKRSEELAKP